MNRLCMVVVHCVLVLVLSTFYFGCGGSGGEEAPTDGDTCNCGPGELCINGECVSTDTDGDRPEPEDGDGSEDDGDLADGDQTDGDTDGDIPDDGDIDVDGIDDAEDDGIGFDGELQEDFIEQEEPYVECYTDEDCGIEGAVCVDNECEFEADGDSDPDCQFCDGHDQCGTGTFCNLDLGCCDDVERPFCASMDECPDWAFCSPLQICDYECLEDQDCHELYEPGYCCHSRGRCAPLWICDGADDDPDEPSGCNDCQDCLEQFGDGYYCNVDSGTCQLGECCEDDDCDEQENGICNLHNGSCNYNVDPDPSGTIRGEIRVHSAAASNVYWVYAQYLNGTEVRRDGPLQAVLQGEEYIVHYALRDLPFDIFNVYMEVEEIPGMNLPYAFNPVGVNQDNTPVEDIDFYYGLDDPRLATISGTVMVGSPYENDTVVVRLLRKISDDSIVEAATTVAGELVESGRSFSFSGLDSGIYYADAYLISGDSIVEDHYTAGIVIDLDSPEPDVDGIDLYFGEGIGDDELGSISGIIFHPEYMDDSAFEVWLYDDDDYPFELAKAKMGEGVEGGVSYSLANIEPGSYWLQGVFNADELLMESLPTLPLRMDVAYGGFNDIVDRNLYFDVERPDKGSISGTLSLYEELLDYSIHVSVYEGSRDDLLRDDPVLSFEYDDMTGSFFIEALDSGSYYLKAVAVSEGGSIEVEYPDAISVSVEGPTKDVSGISIVFVE